MSDSPERPLVVVTGATGFVAQHCVQQLLQQGYRVRTTARNLSAEGALRKVLASDEDESSRLSFHALDLTKAAGWREVVAGATYVLHVASPVPKAPPKHESDLIIPAVEGTMRVLEAAAEAAVKRVVLTSSIAAVSSGRERVAGATFTEADWSDPQGKLQAYARSKTLAERAAWEFQAKLTGAQGFELCTINPVFVVGPSLDGHRNASNEIIRKLVDREVPGLPRLLFPLVDVRDTAAAHLLAMTHAHAAGQRFIVSAHDVWYSEIATVLRQGGHRVATRELPDWMVRVVGWFDPTVRLVVPGLRWDYHTSSEKARRVLGWKTRTLKETVLDTAADLVRLRAKAARARPG